MQFLLGRLRRGTVIIPFLLALLACTCGGNTTTSSVITPPTDTATAASGTPAAGDTPTSPPATPLPVSITNCIQIPSFASAGTASAGSGFGDVTFPANSVSYLTQTYSDTYALTTYHFSLINVCSNGADVNAIHTFFATKLTTGGWNTSTTFPFQGNPTRACGDPYCWRDGSVPVRDVGLENVQASGSVATYTLRLGTAPTPSATIVVRTNTTLTGGTNQSISVSCQGSEQMLGGGFLSHNPGGDPPANPAFTPDANYPSAANTWTVTSGATGYALNLTAYAICMQANYSVGAQIIHNHVAISSSQDIPANCASSAITTGGGFKLTPGGDFGQVEYSVPLTHGWQIGFHTSTASMADVWAICATQNMQTAGASDASFSISNNAIAAYTHACSGGALLISGGFTSPGYLDDYGNFPDSNGTHWVTEVWNESLLNTYSADNTIVCDTLKPIF